MHRKKAEKQKVLLTEQVSIAHRSLEIFFWFNARDGQENTDAPICNYCCK